MWDRVYNVLLAYIGLWLAFLEWYGDQTAHWRDLHQLAVLVSPFVLMHIFLPAWACTAIAIGIAAPMAGFIAMMFWAHRDVLIFRRR